MGLYLPIAFLQLLFSNGDLKPAKGSEDKGWNKRDQDVFTQLYWWTIVNVQEITMSKWIFWVHVWNMFISIFDVEEVPIRVADYDFYNMSENDMIIKLFFSMLLWPIWLALDISSFSIVAPYFGVWWMFNNWPEQTDMKIATMKELNSDDRQMKVIRKNLWLF